MDRKHLAKQYTLLCYPQISLKFRHLWKHQDFFGNIKMFLTYLRNIPMLLSNYWQQIPAWTNKTIHFRQQHSKIVSTIILQSWPDLCHKVHRLFSVIFSLCLSIGWSKAMMCIQFTLKTKIVILPECVWSFCSSDSWLDPSDPGGDRRPQNLSIICERAGLYVGRGCGNWGRGSPSDIDSNIFISFFKLFSFWSHKLKVKFHWFLNNLMAEVRVSAQ